MGVAATWIIRFAPAASVVIGVLAFSTPALALDCSRLGETGSVTLLNAIQTSASGARSVMRFCLRHGQPMIIDTLDADGRMTMRTTYEGLRALSNELIGKGQTCSYRYGPVSGDPVRYRPGDVIKFVYSVEGCAPLPPFAVRIDVGQPTRTDLSGCRLEALQVTRTNVSNVTQRFALVIVPALNWPVESRMLDSSTPGQPTGQSTIVESIGEPEEVERWCLRPAS